MIDETTLAQQISPHFAGYMNNVCHHVTARSVERFTGPFNHTLNNEMLIIGNTADVSSHSCLTENDMLMVKKPITPVQNAKKVNDLLHHSSRLVIQDGSGVSRLLDVIDPPTGNSSTILRYTTSHLISILEGSFLQRKERFNRTHVHTHTASADGKSAGELCVQ